MENLNLSRYFDAATVRDLALFHEPKLHHILPYFSQLQVLTVFNCSELPQQVFEQWPRCSKLRELRLDRMHNIWANNCDTMWHNFPNLEKVRSTPSTCLNLFQLEIFGIEFRNNF
jgi:hypothetical protein